MKKRLMGWFLALCMAAGLTPSLSPLLDIARAYASAPQGTRVELVGDAFKPGSYVVLDDSRVTLIEEDELGIEMVENVGEGQERLYRFRLSRASNGPLLDTPVAQDSIVFVADRVADDKGGVKSNYYLLRVQELSDDGYLTGKVESPFTGSAGNQEDMGYFLEADFDLDFSKAARVTVNPDYAAYVQQNGVQGTREKDFSIPIEDLPIGHGITLSSTLEGTGVFNCSYSWRKSQVKLQFYVDWALRDTKITYGSLMEYELWSLPIAKIDLVEALVMEVGFEVKLVLGLSGKASLVFDVSGRVGVGFDSSKDGDSKIYSIYETPSFEFRGIELEGKVFMAVHAGPAIEVLFGLLSLEAGVTAGIEITGAISSVEMYDADKRWHSCEPFKCLYGEIAADISWGFSVSFAKWSRSLAHRTLLHQKLSDWYYSFTYNDGAIGWEKECPHSGYRLKVHVMSPVGEPVRSAEVSASLREEKDRERYQDAGKIKGTVDADHPFATLYLPVGKSTVAAEGTYNGNPFTLSVSFDEEGYEEGTKKLAEEDLYLRLEEHYVHFEDPESAHGQASNMPAEIAFCGQSVTLSDQAPVKDGYRFKGWSRSTDGANPIAPGSRLETGTQDVTLYASWEACELYIVFDANGGVFDDGTSTRTVTLHTDEALDGNDIPASVKRFDSVLMGWSTDKDAVRPEPVDTQTPRRKGETYYAVFGPQPHKVTVTVDGGGTAYADRETALTGERVTLTAIPDADYELIDWHVVSGDVFFTNNTFVMPPCDVEIVAIFREEEYKLDLEKGLSDVPDALKKDPDLNTVDKIVLRMEKELGSIGPATNTCVYDATLLVSIDDGKTWQKATEDIFPLGGLPIVLPYPEGTDQTYSFRGVHMYTRNSDRLGTRAGGVEKLKLRNDTDGLHTMVHGLSPIMLAWESRIAITRQPEDRTVPEGQKAVFSVKAEGRGLTYQWYVDRNDGNGWQALAGATETQYTTSAAKLSDNGFRYYCLVRGEDAPEGIHSDTARLYVVREVPRTGDRNAVGLWMLLLAVSCAVLCAAALGRKRAR